MYLSSLFLSFFQYNLKDLQETTCFIDNERMIATEDLNALQMTRDADLIAIAKSIKQLWTATRHTINWLAVEGGMDKGNQVNNIRFTVLIK